MTEGPIIYTEKGIGLHQTIESTGHYLKQEDGVWLGGGPRGPAYVQAIIDTYQAPAPLRTLPVPQFYLLLTSDERVDFRAATDPKILDFMKLLDDQRLTAVVLDDPALAEALKLAVALQILDPERPAQIIAGQRPTG